MYNEKNTNHKYFNKKQSLYEDDMQRDEEKEVNQEYEIYSTNDSGDKAKIKMQRPLVAANGGITSINITVDNRAESLYNEAFMRYLRKGIEPERGGNWQNDTYGKDEGYRVTKRIADKITKGLNNISTMRSVAEVITVSRDSYDRVDMPEYFKAGWSMAEVEANDSMDIKKTRVPVCELYAQPKATQQLLDDASIDIESWLAKELVDGFCDAEENAFINGTGVGMPQGVLNSGLKGIDTIAPEITVDDLLRLFYSLDSKYTANAKFIMGREAIHALRTLKDSTGRYLWQSSTVPGQNDTLMGCEVLISRHMPKLRDAMQGPMIPGAAAVMLGDWSRAYQIVDRQDIRVLRDPFTHKPYVKFYTTKRVGGSVNRGNAARILRIRK